MWPSSSKLAGLATPSHSTCLGAAAAGAAAAQMTSTVKVSIMELPNRMLLVGMPGSLQRSMGGIWNQLVREATRGGGPRPAGSSRSSQARFHDSGPDRAILGDCWKLETGCAAG